MTFGKRLRQLRNEFNLTQTQLAEKISLSKANVSKYEADSVEPNLQTLRLLSKFFSVSIDYLLGETEDRTAGKYWISIDEIDNLDVEAFPEGTVFAIKFDVSATPELIGKFEDKLKSLGIDYEYKIKAAPEGLPLSELEKALLTATSGLSSDDMKKAIEYVELLKLKHKP